MKTKIKIEADNIDQKAISSSEKVNIKPQKKLISQVKVYEQNKAEIKVVEGFSSFRCREHSFSNFLRDSSADHYNKVSSILNLVGKELTNENLPFDLDEDILTKHKRQVEILNASNIKNINELLKNTIHKSIYKSEVDNYFGILSRRQSNPIRIYYVEDTVDNIRQIYLVLIDVHHLFATGDRNSINNSYKKVRSYNYDMKKILNNKT